MLQTLAKKQSVGDGASSRKALLATTANRRWQASRPQARSQQLRKFARPPRVSVGRSGRKKNRAQKKPDAGKSQGSGQLRLFLGHKLCFGHALRPAGISRNPILRYLPGKGGGWPAWVFSKRGAGVRFLVQEGAAEIQRRNTNHARK